MSICGYLPEKLLCVQPARRTRPYRRLCGRVMPAARVDGASARLFLVAQAFRRDVSGAVLVDASPGNALRVRGAVAKLHEACKSQVENVQYLRDVVYENDNRFVRGGNVVCHMMKAMDEC